MVENCDKDFILGDIMNNDVVALGELLVDFTPCGISEQDNPEFEACPGGAPCNVLSMLSKLGRKTAFIGKVGEDSFGEMLAAAIREQGISTDGLKMDREIPTTLAFVHTAPDGDRSFSFYRKPGADLMLKKDEIEEDLIKNSKVFHFGTLSMTDDAIEETTKEALRLAKENGALITFDPNLRPPLWDSLERAKEKMFFGIDECDVLKISDDEIEFLTGEKDIDKGVNKILAEHPVKLVFATMGKDGSKAFYDGRIIKGEPFIREDTIETTGAGDTFMACVIDAVLENGIDDLIDEKLAEILRFANAASSIITTRRGALRSMPEKEEVEALLREG